MESGSLGRGRLTGPGEGWAGRQCSCLWPSEGAVDRPVGSVGGWSRGDSGAELQAKKLRKNFFTVLSPEPGGNQRRRGASIGSGVSAPLFYFPPERRSHSTGRKALRARMKSRGRHLRALCAVPPDSDSSRLGTPRVHLAVSGLLHSSWNRKAPPT